MRYLWVLSVVTVGFRNDSGGHVAAFVFTAPPVTILSCERLPRTPPEGGQRRRGHSLSASTESTATAHASLGIGASSGTASSSSAGRYGLAALSTRAQRLRELLLNKEILNDLTEAEFALTLAQSFEAAGNTGEDEQEEAAAENKGLFGGVSSAFGASARTAERRGASSIDFETLLSKLARHDASLEERLDSLPARDVATKASPSSSSSSSGAPSANPTVFAGLSAAQLATLAARVRDLATDLSAVMERRDRARQAAAQRAAAAAAAATAAATQEGNATDASKSDSATGSGGAGFDFLRRNKKIGALFPSTEQKETKQGIIDQDANESIVDPPSSSTGGKGTTTSGSPAESAPASVAATADDASSSSSSVEELVESMVANPSGASKAMKQQFAVFVREDGTVDFDKAVETGKEVARYSAELWARLSGEPPKGDSSSPSSPADGMEGGESSSGTGTSSDDSGGGEKRPLRFDEILRLVDSSEPVQAAATRFASAQRLLRETSERLRPRVDVAPTINNNNNGVAAAFTTAVVTRGATTTATTSTTAAPAIASAAPPGDAFQQKRALAVAERAATRRARLAALDLDMERSCGVLATEIDQSAAEAWTESWRSDQRRLVAEFGLLDAQLAVLLGVLQAAEEEAAATVEVAESKVEARSPNAAVSFEALDANGDGAVSRDEFEAWKQQQIQQQGKGTSNEAVGTGASNGVAATATTKTSTTTAALPMTGPTMDALVLSRIDADELEVVTRQVVDLVQRLGVKPVDPFSAGPVLSTSLGRAGGAGADSETGEEAGGGSFWLGFGGNSGAGGGASGSGNGVGGFLGLPSPILSWERMPRNLGESWGKFVGGVDFYATGTKLLGDDINYAFALLLKAAGGTTLSQREARTLRRTAKDLVTVVPVVIILIIPLSPVGHVLVFSFIQRIFPDFFPSPFTERRQNLMKLYDAIAPPPENDKYQKKK